MLTRQAHAQENEKESEEQGSKEDIPQIAISKKLASILCSNSDSDWLLLSKHLRGGALLLFVRGRAQGAEPEAWWRWGNRPQTWYTTWKTAELHLGWWMKVSIVFHDFLFACVLKISTNLCALQRARIICGDQKPAKAMWAHVLMY